MTQGDAMHNDSSELILEVLAEGGLLGESDLNSGTRELQTIDVQSSMWKFEPWIPKDLCPFMGFERIPPDVTGCNCTSPRLRHHKVRWMLRGRDGD